MATEPLDLEAVAEEAGADQPWSGLDVATTIGHVHLHVPDLAAAEELYCGEHRAVTHAAAVSGGVVRRGRRPITITWGSMSGPAGARLRPTPEPSDSTRSPSKARRPGTERHGRRDARARGLPRDGMSTASEPDVFLQLPDRRLRARWHGAITPPADPYAPTLVFLHEGLGCVELWRTFPEALCARTGLRGLCVRPHRLRGVERLAVRAGCPLPRHRSPRRPARRCSMLPTSRAACCRARRRRHHRAAVRRVAAAAAARLSQSARTSSPSRGRWPACATRAKPS